MGVTPPEDAHSTRVLREFSVWSYDYNSRLATREVRLGHVDVATVADLLNISAAELCVPGPIYIDKTIARILSEFFSVAFVLDADDDVALCSWSPTDGLPYRLHTGREFVLMKAGLKPMCSLIGRIPRDETFEEVPEYLFDPDVDRGNFVKKDYCEVGSARGSPYNGLRVVLYALATEAWRLDAYVQVRLAAKKFGWSEILTYQEGGLLGYSEIENEVWIQRLRRNKI